MDVVTRQDWGRRLKERRKGFGLTQERLAELAGTNQSIVSKIEQGQINVTDEMKWRLAGALGCGVAHLFPWPAVKPPFPAGEDVA